MNFFLLSLYQLLYFFYLLLISLHNLFLLIFQLNLSYKKLVPQFVFKFSLLTDKLLF